MKVWGKRTDMLILELCYDFDLTNNILVELLHVFGWYPIFLMNRSADRPGFITIKEGLSYTKPRHITTLRLVISCIPIASYLSRVFCQSIENRLFRQPGRE